MGTTDMIEYEGLGFVVYCDGCDYDETFFLERDEWQTLMEEMRSSGWTKKNINGEWLHFCDRCLEDD